MTSQNKPVTMGRGDFKAYMCNIVNQCDDDSFQGLCTIMLTACGVIDANGKLTEQYANSPYWAGGDDGTPLRPSEHAELANQLSPDVREVIYEIFGKDAENAVRG